jgi:hypothetical protein
VASATVFLCLRHGDPGKKVLCYTRGINNNKEFGMNLTHVFADINWLAVLAALVAAFVLGGIWYSKALFGNIWMQEIGLTEEAVNNANMARTFGGTILLEALAAIALAAFLGRDAGWLEGLHTGLWIGLFWVSTAYGITYLFEQRSLRIWLINAGYYVVLYAVMGTIIGMMN